MVLILWWSTRRGVGDACIGRSDNQGSCQLHVYHLALPHHVLDDDDDDDDDDCDLENMR